MSKKKRQVYKFTEIRKLTRESRYTRASATLTASARHNEVGGKKPELEPVFIWLVKDCHK